MCKKQKLFLFSLLLVCSIQCQKPADVIMTVTGPVHTRNPGYILEHEHLLVDFIGARETGYHRWNRDSVITKVLPYLSEVRSFGVEMIFDATPAFLGRDPLLLKQLSELSGVLIITTTGYYGAMENKYLPDDFFRSSIDDIAQKWITEWKNGIENTAVRPGFIKIAVDTAATLSGEHQKLIRAAARTHLQTGLTIASHTGPDGPALTQLKILSEEGVSPEAFIWVHAQDGTPEGFLKAMSQGAWISFDNVEADSVRVAELVLTLTNLKTKGYLDHILISHDAGWYNAGEKGGGTFRGFTDIFTHLLPELKKQGFTKDEIDQLLIKNPVQAFKVRIRNLK